MFRVGLVRYQDCSMLQVILVKIYKILYTCIHNFVILTVSLFYFLQHKPSLHNFCENRKLLFKNQLLQNTFENCLESKISSSEERNVASCVPAVVVSWTNCIGVEQINKSDNQNPALFFCANSDQV